MVSKSDYRLVEAVLSKPLAPLNREFASMSNAGLNVVCFFYIQLSLCNLNSVLLVLFTGWYLEFCLAKASFHAITAIVGVILNDVTLRHATAITPLQLPVHFTKLKTSHFQRTEIRGF